MRETMDEAIIRLLWQRLVLAGGWHPEVLLDSLADDISPETLARLRRIVDERMRETRPEAAIMEPCDGMCVTAADVGLPGYGIDAIAHVHPGCPRHDPGGVCDCGTPDRCMSPTHGQISHAEALRIRHRQNPSDPRAWPDQDGRNDA